MALNRINKSMLSQDVQDDIAKVTSGLTDKAGNTYTDLKSRLDKMELIRQEESFTSTANQQVFTLTTGSYVMNAKRLQVIVGGVSQRIGEGFTETTTKSFTLSDPIPAGVPVVAIWLEGLIPYTTGMSSVFKKGGQESIDVSELAGYQEKVQDKIGILSKDTDERGVNIFSKGVIPEDSSKATSNATIINNLLSQGKNLQVPTGNIYIDDTLNVPANQMVRGSGSSTVFRMTNVNKHVFRIKSYSQVHDLNIQLPLGSTGAGLYINTEDEVYFAACSNIKINGFNRVVVDGVPTVEDSKGVFLEGGATAGKNIYYCKFDGITAWQTGTGFKCDAKTSWINANHFTKANLVGNTKAIDGGFNGSTFTFVAQPPQTGCTSVIKCSGSENMFDGYVYDVQYVQYVYEFTSTSQKNSYRDVSGLWKYQFTFDAGLNNNAIGAGRFSKAPYMSKQILAGADSSGVNYEYTDFLGMQDNALAYADKRDTVTLNSGTISYGSVGKIFNLDGPFDGTNFNDPSVTNVEIEVVLTSPLRYVTSLGILGNAKAFDVLYKSTAGGSYTTLISITNNQKGNWQLYPNSTGLTSVYAFKFVFKEAISIGSYNTAKALTLINIWCNDSLTGGNAFLRKSGGDVYGTLTAKKGLNAGVFTPTARPGGLAIGTTVFDSTLGKNITLKSLSPDKWVDQNGSPVWTPFRDYVLNEKVVTDNNVYQCTVAGRTSNIMPTHVAGTATDGTTTWTYVKSII